jgi:polyketide synthase PksN
MRQWEICYLQFVKQCQASDELGKLASPSLVIAGEEDRVVKPDISRRLYSQLNQASFLLLEDAGHFLPMRHADWFNRYLEQHLTGADLKHEYA